MRTTGENKIKKLVKKATGIGLCAIVIGGLSQGGFTSALSSDTPKNVYASSKKVDKVLLKSDDDVKEKDLTKGGMDVSNIVKEAMPSVVAISTKSVKDVQNYFDIFGRSGAPSQKQEVEASGSGIIIGKNDKELLIATNNHVIEGADELSVSFVNDKTIKGVVKGFDAGRDLAVVAVKLSDLDKSTEKAIKIAKIGNSDDIEVGEQVVAIGNALGHGQSVTTGIVSAKNKRLDDENGKKAKDGVNLIQTDAAINPGNSGGALLNMKGEVIGINSIKLASTEVEGMGYAIAITDVSKVLENLMNQQTREKLKDDDHGVLSIKARNVSKEASTTYGIPQGVFIAEVTKGGAMDKAGVSENSVITEVDGKEVKDVQSLISTLQYYKPDEKVKVTVQVPDGSKYKEKTVEVTLDKKPKDDSQNKDNNKNDAKSNDSKDNSDSKDNNGNEKGDNNGVTIFGDDGSNPLQKFFDQFDNE